MTRELLLKEYKKFRLLRDPEQRQEVSKWTLDELKEALKLRQDVAELAKHEDPKSERGKRFKHYLKKSWANLEYEYSNNGLCNLIEWVEEAFNNGNPRAERFLRDWGKDGKTNYGDCEECGEFGELNNGWGKNEGYHYMCQPEAEE